jgi:predicted dehydrogenase
MRVAIVGTGGIARVHQRVVRELGGKVVGVCGRSLASAQAFSSAPAYDNLAAMLREQNPDVLNICMQNRRWQGLLPARMSSAKSRWPHPLMRRAG